MSSRVPVTQQSIYPCRFLPLCPAECAATQWLHRVQYAFPYYRAAIRGMLVKIAHLRLGCGGRQTVTAFATMLKNGINVGSMM